MDYIVSGWAARGMRRRKTTPVAECMVALLLNRAQSMGLRGARVRTGSRESDPRPQLPPAARVGNLFDSTLPSHVRYFRMPNRDSKRTRDLSASRRERCAMRSRRWGFRRASARCAGASGRRRYSVEAGSTFMNPGAPQWKTLRLRSCLSTPCRSCVPE